MQLNVLGHEESKVGVNRCSVFLSVDDIIYPYGIFIIKTYSYPYLRIHFSCYDCQHHKHTHVHISDKEEKNSLSQYYSFFQQVGVSVF